MFKAFSSNKRKLFWLIGLLIVGKVGSIWLAPVWQDVLYRLGYSTPLADYNQLEDLLQSQQWKEADLETMRAMLQVANRERQGFLSAWDLGKFPCGDLKKIDQLWVQHSNGRFGFSLQRQIFDSLRDASLISNTVPRNPGTRSADSQGEGTQIRIPPELLLMDEFSKRVGWNNKKGICTVSGTGIALYPHPKNCKGSIQIDAKTPSGHLPSWGVFIPEPYNNSNHFSIPALSKRQKKCFNE